jgi:hypothetical protein
MVMPKDPIKRAETIKRMSDAIKLKFKDPLYQESHKHAMQKRSQTPEWREKMRKQALDCHSDPNKKQNYINAIHQRSQNQEWRNNIKIGAQKRAKDPEWRKKNKEINQKRAKDPGWLEKQRQNALNQHSDPICKQKFIDAIQKRSQNPEWGNKISLSKKGKCNGSKNSNWKGGLSFEPYCEKFNNDLKNRVRSFWNYTCGECGMTQENNNKKLSVHHVHYDKLICCNNKIIMFVPLCDSCHMKTNYNRTYYEQKFTNLINTKYNGKSYYTKEEYEKL